MVSTLHRLSESTVFGALDRGTLERLASSAVQRTLQSRETLWHRGECPDAVAVVLSGRLDVVRVTERGDRMLLRALRPPDAVGLSTVAGKEHTADLVAAEMTELAVIRGEALRAVLAGSPEMALRVVAQLGELLGRLTDEVEELRFRELDDRLSRCIDRHAKGRREIRIT